MAHRYVRAEQWVCTHPGGGFDAFFALQISVLFGSLALRSEFGDLQMRSEESAAHSSHCFLPLFQKMKEYLEGRNLITKLQAKHDLLQKTLGESEWRPACGCPHYPATCLELPSKVGIFMFHAFPFSNLPDGEAS